MLKRPMLSSLFSIAVVTPLAIGGGGFGWIWAVLGISFLIAVHEWGHYMACVLTKTRTETFSIGFGPRLFGWERDADGSRRFTVGARQLDPLNHTMDFRIALVPLGGYVKMAGGEIIGESTSKDPDEFVNKSASARLFIICAGVVMNAITAFVLFALSFGTGKPVQPATVGTVVPGGPAWRAGMLAGDEILDIDGTRTRSWLDVRMEVVLGAGDKRAKVRVKRQDQEIDLSVQPEYQEEGGHLAIQAGPATRLTMGAGDEELTIGFSDAAKINGWPVRGGAEAGETITTLLQLGTREVTVESGGKSKILSIEVPAGEKAPGDTPKPRVGIEARMRFKVTDLRAPAQDVLSMGDELVAVVSNGTRHSVESITSLQRARLRAPVESIVVLRDDKELSLPVTLTEPAAARDFFDSVGTEAKDSGRRVRPLEPGHLAQTASGIWRYTSSPAADAGVVAGDEILRIANEEMNSWEDILKAIQGAEPGQPLDMVVRSKGQAERTVTVTPVDLEFAGTLDLTVTERTPFQVDGVGDALGIGVSRTWREVKNVFRTIGGLFSGDINFQKNIAGPITLITASKSQADAGLPSLFWFLGYISVMLAVLNILPIPVLDGGHALFIIIEKIKGSPLKESVVIKAMYVGLFLLLTLMFFAFKNDIGRLLS